MKQIRYLALAALVAFAACDEEGAVVDPTPETGAVTVTVTGGGGGLANVTVSLTGAQSQSLQTGGNGTVTFNNIEVGSYAVTISGVGSDFACGTTSQSVTVTANQTSNVSFTCNLVMTASISGTVTRGAEPLPGATLNLTRLQPAGGSTETLQTGANGQYAFTGLRSGTYQVTLTQPEGVACAVNTQEVELSVGEAQIVNFSCEEEVEEPEDASITIESITVPGPLAGTTVPANPDSLAGRVEVTVNIDPRGNDLVEYKLMVRGLDGTVFEICRQSFVSEPVGAPAAQDNAQEITCSWSTDRIRSRLGGSTVRTATAVNGEFSPLGDDPMRPHHPVFLNDEYELIARVVTEEGDPQQAIVDVTTVNEDAVVLGVEADNSNWGDPTDPQGQPFPDMRLHPTTGLRWLSGDIHLTVFPVIFSEPFDPNEPLLATAGFQFDGFLGGADTQFGATGIAGHIGFQAADGTFRFSFCELGGATATNGSPCYASIAGLNTGHVGARNIMLQTITRFGQFGPTLSNIKTIFFFDQDLQSGTRGTLNDVMRIDNQGPAMPALGLDDHPVPGFSRWGGSAGSSGWVNWVYDFSDGWTAPASDNPTAYPAVTKTGGAPPGPDGISGTADDGTWCDAAADLCVAPASPILGIGVPTGAPHQVFHRGPDVSPTVTVGQIIPALGAFDRLVETGADLTPETDSPGLPEVGSAEGTPFSDTENDYALAGRAWDRFGNPRNSARIFIGVDGLAPIFSVGPEGPTEDGGFYNTYGNTDALGAPKDPGQYTGTTTDTNNGFSGVAGIELVDLENGCAPGVLACIGDPRNFRGDDASDFAEDLYADSDDDLVTGKKVQPIAPGGATFPLAWIFDAGADGAGENNICGILCPAFGNDTHELFAFDAIFAEGPPQHVDGGYRQQQVLSWDRAGNVVEDGGAAASLLASVVSDLTDEYIGDKSRPVVGNVQMPTIPTFIGGSEETFNGRVQDHADLKKSDFGFDFHGIETLQTYEHMFVLGSIPNDVDGRPFAERSLQLPLENVPHTFFGSGAVSHSSDLLPQPFFRDEGLTEGIMLDVDLVATAAFLACLVRFDEADVDTEVHRPRGPRFRSWDHASSYGLTNTQHNTFTDTSLPECPDAEEIGDDLVPELGLVGFGEDGVDDGGAGDDGSGPDGIFGTPDDDVSWQFILDDDDRPFFSLKGPTAGFSPNVTPEILSLYYLDAMGRAILLERGSANWTLNVQDYGTGAFGRAFEWTYMGELPTDLTTSAGAPNGYFFVVDRTDSGDDRDGSALIWDETVTP